MKVVFLCSLICGAAIGYVWQKGQLVRLGRQISDRENRLRQLKSDNTRLADEIDYLHSPVMLDRRSRELNLGLAPAQPLQVVRLVDLPPAAVAGEARQFAQRPAAGGVPGY